jgi:hypothetical protein
VNDTSPYLGRCKHEGCSYALFATSEQVRSADDWKAVTAGSGPHRVPNYGVFARCPDRHKVFPLRQIKGTYSKDHKCDARCLNAKGHECTCSCGGMNHGRGYAVEVQTVTHAVEAPKSQGERMVTDPQASFIRTLLAERVVPDAGTTTGEERREKALKLIEDRTMTLNQASNTIKWLLTLPKEA